MHRLEYAERLQAFRRDADIEEVERACVTPRQRRGDARALALVAIDEQLKEPAPDRRFGKRFKNV